MKVKVDVYCGKNSSDYIDLISKLRIEMFSEYPYLYKGQLIDGRKYAEHYLNDSKSIVAVARFGEQIVGISTGIPLLSDSDIISDAKLLFLTKNIEISNYYYYGEVLILREFRGKGIITKLYSAQNALIRSWGFTHTCILTVVKNDDHPLKPLKYKVLDKMWEHLGFFRNKLKINYPWPTIQPDTSVEIQSHTLEFWVKNLGLTNVLPN